MPAHSLNVSRETFSGLPQWEAETEAIQAPQATASVLGRRQKETPNPVQKQGSFHTLCPADASRRHLSRRVAEPRAGTKRAARRHFPRLYPPSRSDETMLSGTEGLALISQPGASKRRTPKPPGTRASENGASSAAASGDAHRATVHRATRTGQRFIGRQRIGCQRIGDGAPHNSALGDDESGAGKGDCRPSERGTRCHARHSPRNTSRQCFT